MSKMELFLIIGDDYKLLTLATKSFILGIARVLNVPLEVFCYEVFGINLDHKPLCRLMLLNASGTWEK